MGSLFAKGKSTNGSGGFNIGPGGRAAPPARSPSLLGDQTQDYFGKSGGGAVGNAGLNVKGDAPAVANPAMGPLSEMFRGMVMGANKNGGNSQHVYDFRSKLQAAMNGGGTGGQAAPVAPPAPLPDLLGNETQDFFKKRPQAGLPSRPGGAKPPAGLPARPGGDAGAAEAWKARYGNYPGWFKG